MAAVPHSCAPAVPPPPPGPGGETAGFMQHSCWMCGKSSATHRDNVTHMMTHLNEHQPYLCMMCGQRFPHGHLMTQHVAAHELYAANAAAGAGAGASGGASGAGSGSSGSGSGSGAANSGSGTSGHGSGHGSAHNAGHSSAHNSGHNSGHNSSGGSHGPGNQDGQRSSEERVTNTQGSQFHPPCNQRSGNMECETCGRRYKSMAPARGLASSILVSFRVLSTVCCLSKPS